MTTSIISPESLSSGPEHRLLIEPVSPFVERTPEHAALIVSKERDQRPSLVTDLLRAPDRVVDRLTETNSLEPLVLGAAAMVVGGLAAFSGVLMAKHGFIEAAEAAGLSAVSVMLALAAALGPIYGTGVLIATRIPMARLAGVLLSATATGALLLAALAPVPYILTRFDPEWAGPLGAVMAFALFGVVTGLRLKTLLLRLAERISAEPLSAPERFRIGILTRMAFAFVAFTTALSFWSFDAFLVG